MPKKAPKKRSEALYDAILMLQDRDECIRFFQDLCTVAELQAMEQRFEVAIDNEILERTGASSATISRVNRSLQYGADGYKRILPRIKQLRSQQEKEKT
jgi:TrpR-related protein YerC/YecD